MEWTKSSVQETRVQLHFQPNIWSCLPTAFSMVLDVLPRDVIEWCGHDGSEIVWPHLRDPLRRRAFCLQEMTDYSISLGKHPVLIYADSAYGPEGEDELYDPYHTGNDARIQQYLAHRCVLFVVTKVGQHRHAVAWCPDAKRVFDPSGLQASLDVYDLELVIPIF